MTRVLVTGDHPFTRHCLAALVASAADLELVGEYDRSADVPVAVRRLGPHVVVMAVRSADLPAIDACLELRDLAPARLLLLISDVGPAGRGVTRAPGVPGYVVRGSRPATVLNAIRLVTFDRPEALHRRVDPQLLGR